MAKRIAAEGSRPVLGFFEHMLLLGTRKGPCKFIFIAGMTAADTDYKCIAPGDYRAQYVKILDDLTLLLNEAGATWDDVVSSHLCGRCRRISQIAG
jgi:enamine deaminase RidA (YjgF/YER057c/UK114 family)